MCLCLFLTNSCCRESPSLNWGLWTRLRQEVATQRDITAATVMMKMAVVVQVVARTRRTSPKSSNVSRIIYWNQSFNLSATLLHNFTQQGEKLNGRNDHHAHQVKRMKLKWQQRIQKCVHPTYTWMLICLPLTHLPLMIKYMKIKLALINEDYVLIRHAPVSYNNNSHQR